MDNDDPETMLAEARIKARRLLEELLKQQDEIDASPPKLSAAKLAEGRHAMQQAIRSTQNMVAALDAAAEISDQAKDSTE